MPYGVRLEPIPPSVYVLITADGLMFKLGHTSDLRERVVALSRMFTFDLDRSFCFHFQGARQSRYAEQELIAYLDGCQVEFDVPFPGSTEYFVESCLVDLFKAFLDKRFRGFITMKRIADALCLEDYPSAA